MNVRYLIIAMVTSLSWQSCQKDTPDDRFYWGKASAVKNDADIQNAKAIGQIDKPHKQGISITIYFFDPNDNITDEIYFYKIPHVRGKHNLTASSANTIDSTHGVAYHALFDQGHGVGDRYILANDIEQNYLNLDKIEGNEIWGTFQAAFVKNQTLSPVNSLTPDTIIFKNGTFHTKISDE